MTTALALSTATQLFEELDVSISLDDSDVNFVALLAVAGHKVRLRIRSNSYDFQCYAYADAWSKSDLRWQNIGDIGHGSMQTPSGLYVRKDWSSRTHFEADARRLLEIVATVLL